jgi:hypothetical protein
VAPALQRQLHQTYRQFKPLDDVEQPIEFSCGCLVIQKDNREDHHQKPVERDDRHAFPLLLQQPARVRFDQREARFAR